MTQPGLPLPDERLPALREAYAVTPSINRKRTFAQAMACKALALALRLHAEAIERMRKKA